MKQLFYINSGQAQLPADPILSMRVGDRHSGFAITDGSGCDLHSLAYYTSSEMDSETIDRIFAAHPELMSDFKQVNVGFDYPVSVLVPYHAQVNGDKSKLLESLHGYCPDQVIITDDVNDWQLQNVYAIPRNIQEWFTRKFPGSNNLHNYTIRIKLPAGLPDRLMVDLHTDECSLIVVKGNKLMLANTYAYSTPDDVLYYLLRACEQFQLSQRDTELCISGLIEIDSQLYKELYQYFLHIGFREPTWTIQGVSAREYPSHFFTSLNDLARCAS